ncbi:hypothetical protein COO60DRAFT_1700269 [Scenedesmus sp. NREL 46B-D3]|nr:hypothetical protein COO60DRAFT_1700269 [Scenedesmus sp. NREL 46B-D3]
MVPGFSLYPFFALWARCIQDGWEMIYGMWTGFELAAEARAAEQDAGTEAEGPAPAPATAEPQLQLSTRLHPQDPRLENLATAADYPHRFNTRPDGNPDQVEWLEHNAAAGSSTWHAPVAHRLHSLNSRELCYLNITNSTPHAVRMLWLDYQGNEVAYEKIAAGGVLRQQTFLTHPWMVREGATGTRLPLNGREAFVPTLQEHQEQVAEARARQQALQQQARQLVQQQAGLMDQRPQGSEAGSREVPGAGGVGVGVGVGLGDQLVVMAGPGSNWPLFEVTIGELPQLQWTKETHRLFPAWFKDSSRAFLMCQQKQQRELYSSAASGSSCLGHVPAELLPLIVRLSAPEVPQGVHFPPVGRADIRPARLSAPPAAAEPPGDSAPAAADAPAGPQQEPNDQGAAAVQQDA